MASDWIKMRGSLLINPKVIRIARILLQDSDFRSWFFGVTSDVSCDECASHAVTSRDAQLVSVVTRVTVGALLPLWSTANDYTSSDAHMRDADLFTIDAISGVPGFGKALLAVGWIALKPNNGGVVFENFGEHNTVGKDRSSSARTGAERTKAYRERVRQESQNSDASHSVTVTSQRDHRREKKREDKTNTPKPPDGGRHSENSKSEKRPTVALKTFLDACRTSGEKPVPEDDPVFAYAETTGIPVEFLRLHWLEFKARYALPDAKRYKDWRAVYRKSVRGNWFHLWFIGADADCKLTTVGEQAKRAHPEAA